MRFCCGCSGLRLRKQRAPREFRIAQEMLAAARSMVQGVQVSAPFGRYSAAAEVLREVLPPGPSANNPAPVPAVAPEEAKVGQL